MNNPYPFRRTRVKICGFTRSEDALAASELGVDAIGLVFYPPSPRHVEIPAARAIAAALPAFVTIVGLFVDETPEAVRAVLEQVRIDVIQFHGDESPSYCAGFGKPYVKAARVRPGFDLGALASAHGAAAGLLLDAWHPDAMGGTGSGFDWSLIPEDYAGDVILAGGLDAGNVGAALRAVRPAAVDVSSGVEAAKGVKDTRKMSAFLKQVHDFDYEQHRD